MRNFGLIYSRLEKKEIGVWFVRSGSINEQICPSMEHWDSSKTQVVVPVFPRLMWLDQVLDSKRGQVKRKCWKVENLIGPPVICKISIAPNYRFTFLFYHFIVKIFKHIEKVEKNHTINTHTHHPHSVINILLYCFFHISHHLSFALAFLVAQLVKNPPAIRETWVRSLGWKDPLEKVKGTHSSILAWRIPWTI